MGEAKVSMLKYKSQPPEKDPFADFDKGFKAGPYRKVEPEENPMSTFDKGYKAPPYRSLEVPPHPYHAQPGCFKPPRPFIIHTGGMMCDAGAWRPGNGEREGSVCRAAAFKLPVR